MDRLGEAVFMGSLYLFLAGAVQTITLLFLLSAASPAMLGVGWRRFLTASAIAFVFDASLAVWGAVGAFVWYLTVYGHLYISRDTVADFIPYVPFGQWVLDQSWGEQTGKLLRGTTLTELRMLWRGLAGVAWACTIATSQWLWRALRFA